MGLLSSWVFRDPRVATRAALLLGGLEIAALGVVVWQVHEHGALQVGRYLRADGLSSFFLINIAFISGLVLVYASGYLRHIGRRALFFAALVLRPGLSVSLHDDQRLPVGQPRSFCGS